jgi:hypothetical protein
MTKRFLRTTLALSVFCVWGTAQSARFTPPRLPDGHPDMQGLWYKFVSEGFDPLFIGLLDGAAVGRGGGRGGGGRAPAPGATGFLRPGVPILPYLPAAAALKKDRAEHHMFDDPEAHCHIPGVPRGTEQPPYPFQIIQDEKYFTILYEAMHDVRIIPMDHSRHPKNYRAWDGDSRAHWEGDTLVIDVSNFNGRTWLDMEADFVDENEHVIERYTLTDADTIAYEATITDPTVFSHPWTMNLTLKRRPKSDQIIEYSCLEGERDLQHYTQKEGRNAK